MPFLIEHDVEGSREETHPSLGLVAVGVDRHPVGMSADATCYSSTHFHIAKLAPWARDHVEHGSSGLIGE